MDVLEYLDRQGRSPFAAWFEDLDPAAAAKVTTAMTRLSLGNISNVKGVSAGVFETKIAFGPGYRVLFWQRRREARYPSGGRDKAAPAAGHHGSTGAMAGL